VNPDQAGALFTSSVFCAVFSLTGENYHKWTRIRRLGRGSWKSAEAGFWGYSHGQCEHPTSNIERPTSNDYGTGSDWMFDACQALVAREMPGNTWWSVQGVDSGDCGQLGGRMGLAGCGAGEGMAGMDLAPRGRWGGGIRFTGFGASKL